MSQVGVTSPSATDLQANAEMIVQRFVKVDALERVSVFFDNRRASEAAALAAAAEAIGAEVARIDITQTVENLLRSGEFWLPLPEHIVALANATTVNIFVVDETFAFRLDHKVATTFETSEDCSIFKVDAGMPMWRMTAEDVPMVDSNCDRIIAALEGAKDVRITTPGGTDLRLSLAGRECLPIFPIPERGKPYGLSVPLWGELNWAPIEAETEGTIVVDGLTEAGPEMHTVSEPVTMEVRGGRVVKVSGGMDAAEFESVFAIDEGAPTVAELGVGANPFALQGHESEKARLGTVHFGFGSNAVYPGGQSRSIVHVDGVVRDVSITAEGNPVLVKGELAKDG